LHNPQFRGVAGLHIDELRGGAASLAADGREDFVVGPQTSHMFGVRFPDRAVEVLGRGEATEHPG
jgi:hypothetical protein